MRNLVLLAVLTFSITSFAPAGDDELFSKVRLDSTSGSNPGPGQPDPRRRPESGPVSSVNSLQALLLAAGYPSRVDGSGIVTIDVTRGDWSAPVAMTFADAGRQLRLAMKLTTPEAGTVIGPATLRGLLEANRKNWSAFFAIAGDPQHIELVNALPNVGLTSESLGETLEGMAEMAEETKAIWNVSGVRIRQAESTIQEPAKAEKPAKPAPAPATEPTAGSIVGKWIATPNTNEAFALQLEDDSTFRLVHVKGTKSTKSKGRYTLNGGTLSLNGDDGNTIAGTVTLQDDRFSLVIKGTGGKTVTLAFKKSS